MTGDIRTRQVDLGDVWVACRVKSGLALVLTRKHVEAHSEVARRKKSMRLTGGRCQDKGCWYIRTCNG